ncbi:hypothetical protein [Elizabethkingia ursingii]|uniref:hypothetical protein n=1 Tax=Elizabethkingia ursingii TaxID=1756150 RepID=UPI0020119D5A|nr:hypothetical protein [Elizabethkingia ursingii]MCL1671739.1 hypothetical protein [Elizabethkingia ursingii]
MKKIKVQVDFTRNERYCANIELTEEEYEMFKDIEDGDDISIYKLENGEYISDPRYDILHPYADGDNIMNSEEEFYNVSIRKL